MNQSQRWLLIFFPLEYITSRWLACINNKVGWGYFGRRFVDHKLINRELFCFSFHIRRRYVQKHRENIRERDSRYSKILRAGSRVERSIKLQHERKIRGRFPVDRFVYYDVYLIWRLRGSNEELLRQPVSKICY